MKTVQEFQIFAAKLYTLDDFEDQYSLFPDIIKLFKISRNHSVSSIKSLGSFLDYIIKKMILTKKVTALPRNKTKISYNEDLTSFIDQALDILRNIVETSKNEELQVTSLEVLLSLLIFHSELYDKSKFPLKEFSLNLASIIIAEANVSSLLNVLEPNMHFQDVAASFWESIRRVLSLESLMPLKPNHVKNIISIINLNTNKIEELNKTLCGKKCKYDKKKIGVIVRSVWDHLATVKLPDDIQQKLSLTLIEHIMPLIDKPVILTDYFMTCLNIKGPNALIALQGIFNLLQKFNINYPNVYTKLYTMFEPEIFATPYKARFYYLSDIFLTSLCLPEGMVAGFIKRISRLSLVAPPEDIIILLAFITNLLIRHPSLKYLVNSSSFETVDTDPYDYNEKDPTKSKANESSLWEVKLLQEHVLPNISAAAMFINEPLPSVEKDLAKILENTSDHLFVRECKKKPKGEIPVNFEKPFSIRIQNRPSSFNLWSIP